MYLLHLHEKALADLTASKTLAKLSQSELRKVRGPDERPYTTASRNAHLRYLNICNDDIPYNVTSSGRVLR